jgi:AI-2 transport protein TqsA
VSDEGQRIAGGARFLLVAASVVVVVAGLRAASQVILPFMVALFIAVLSFPLLFWLRSLGVRTPLAVLCTIVADIAVLAGIGFLLGGSVNDFTNQLPKYQSRLEEVWRTTEDWMEARNIPVSNWVSFDTVNPGAILDLMRGTLRGVAAVLSNTLLVLLTTIFILSEAASFPAKLQDAFQGDRPGPWKFSNVTTEVQHYLAIKTGISLVTGIVLGTWVGILGVDFPVLWGVAAFILNFIPTLGSIIAAVPTVLLALVDLGPGRALLVALGYVVVNLILGNFVEPTLMGRKLGLSTLVVFLSLVFWGWVWGPVGMLLSVPLTMIVKIMLENTEDLHWVSVLLGPSSEPGPLRRRAARAEKAGRAARPQEEGPTRSPAPELASRAGSTRKG